MKEMIDGMLYDTCTATPIGNYDNGGGRMEGIKESLFQKKTGEFFLCILAGPKTKYGDPLDKTQRMVSLIEPLDLDEARFWGELHLSPRKYAQVFDKYQDCEDVFVTGLGEGFFMESIVTLEGIDCWLRHQDSNERLHVDVPAIGNSLPEDCGPGEYYHRALWAIDTLGLIPIFKEWYFQGN